MTRSPAARQSPFRGWRGIRKILTEPFNKMRGPCLSNSMATTIASRFTSGALEQVLEELFREHWQLVYRAAFSVLRNRHDAEDVLQNIFLKLFERELPADLPRNLPGYFYRAAVNASLNVVRSRKNEVVTADFHPLRAPMPDAASDNDSVAIGAKAGSVALRWNRGDVA